MELKTKKMDLKTRYAVCSSFSLVNALLVFRQHEMCCLLLVNKGDHTFHIEHWMDLNETLSS